MTKKLEVHYACDSNGDHTVNMAECTESNIKEFTTVHEKETFISECTYVYELDKALGNVINSQNIPNPILDCLEENYV
jgi:hypothetical protein